MIMTCTNHAKRHVYLHCGKIAVKMSTNLYSSIHPQRISKTWNTLCVRTPKIHNIFMNTPHESASRNQSRHFHKPPNTKKTQSLWNKLCKHRKTRQFKKNRCFKINPVWQIECANLCTANVIGACKRRSIRTNHFVDRKMCVKVRRLVVPPSPKPTGHGRQPTRDPPRNLLSVKMTQSVATKSTRSHNIPVVNPKTNAGWMPPPNLMRATIETTQKTIEGQTDIVPPCTKGVYIKNTHWKTHRTT